MAANHVLHLHRVGKINFHAYSVSLSDRIHAIIGLLIEPAGIQRKDPKPDPANTVYHVNQDRSLGLKGTGEGMPRMIVFERQCNDLKGS
jgi:hypothetical protein